MKTVIAAQPEIAKTEKPKRFTLEITIQEGADANRAIHSALAITEKWLGQRATDSLTINGQGASGTAKVA